jgi:cell division protein FtsB|tara:strand:+ start:568 stop:771 length:204 start_codon:yes stop_codon:yes gene_type:complete
MWELYELNKQLDIQVKINADYQKENEALKAEVDDLKKRTNAIEERARSELGMVKKDEIFFQVINKPK